MKKITINTRFVVYELNNVMSSERHKALHRIEFDTKHNGFDSEEEAIQALIDEDKCFENYLIIKEVYLN